MVQYCVLVSHGRHAELPHPRIGRVRDVRDSRAGMVSRVRSLGDRGERFEAGRKETAHLEQNF